MPCIEKRGKSTYCEDEIQGDDPEVLEAYLSHAQTCKDRVGNADVQPGMFIHYLSHEGVNRWLSLKPILKHMHKLNIGIN